MKVSRRECGVITRTYIYLCSMIVFPVISIVFFLSLMESGLPLEMPVGIVDLDNTATTRSLVRRLDAFQTTKVIARYPNIDEARHAIQRNEIYAFLYFPKGTTSELMSARRPNMLSFISLKEPQANSCLPADQRYPTTTPTHR